MRHWKDNQQIQTEGLSCSPHLFPACTFPASDHINIIIINNNFWAEVDFCCLPADTPALAKVRHGGLASQQVGAD